MQHNWLQDNSFVFKWSPKTVITVWLWCSWPTSMMKHFSWDPPVSSDSSYFRLRRFSFSSITGFFPFLVKIGPWLLCWGAGTKLFAFNGEGTFQSKIMTWRAKECTFSDVVEAGTMESSDWLSASATDSALISEPVGRPRSSSTWKRQNVFSFMCLGKNYEAKP